MPVESNTIWAARLTSAKPHPVNSVSELQSPDRILYSDKSVCIGLFDCPRDHPMFADSGPISGDLIVFPRDAVKICHHRRDPVIADARVTTVYNRNQEYRRQALSPYGDRSLWLRFPRAAVTEALIDAGKTHPRLDSQPFNSVYSRCTAGAYLKARELTHYLSGENATASMAVHEQAYDLLRATVDALPDASFSIKRNRPGTEKRHRALATECRALLGCRFRESLSLATIASELNTTPFHLSRIFSEHHGTSIHEHLVNLRLRAAVDELISEPGRRLTDIGLDLGFATPSHFSSRFRRLFGRKPGDLRRASLQ